jgi:N-acetylmuramic acid 6-phosphate (MurNAc-6-P) etherase
MVAELAGVDPATAATALDAADNRVKPAVLVARGLSVEGAAARLAAADGDLRRALGE